MVISIVFKTNGKPQYTVVLPVAYFRPAAVVMWFEFIPLVARDYSLDLRNGFFSSVTPYLFFVVVASNLVLP